MDLELGQRIVVRTPDQRTFGGWLVEVKRQGERKVAVVRLDTGWVTTYPVSMVHPETESR